MAFHNTRHETCKAVGLLKSRVTHPSEKPTWHASTARAPSAPPSGIPSVRTSARNGNGHDPAPYARTRTPRTHGPQGQDGFGAFASAHPPQAHGAQQHASRCTRHFPLLGVVMATAKQKTAARKNLRKARKARKARR